MEMNRLAIIGSRTITDYALLKEIFLKYFCDEYGPKITEIVSGSAAGVDTLGADLAKEFRIKLTEFPAEWDNLNPEVGTVRIKEKNGRRYNADAGFNRNKLIIDNCDFVLALTTGSPGTKDSLNYAAKKKIPCLIWYV